MCFGWCRYILTLNKCDQTLSVIRYHSLAHDYCRSKVAGQGSRPRTHRGWGTTAELCATLSDPWWISAFTYLKKYWDWKADDEAGWTVSTSIIPAISILRERYRFTFSSFFPSAFLTEHMKEFDQSSDISADLDISDFIFDSFTSRWGLFASLLLLFHSNGSLGPLSKPEARQAGCHVTLHFQLLSPPLLQWQSHQTISMYLW